MERSKMPETVWTDAELGLTEQDLTNTDGTPLDENIRREIRASRVVRRENETLKAQIAANERADAYRKAGIPDTPLGAMFVKANPDLTDPDEIKAKFAEIAPAASEGTPATPPVTSTPDTAASQAIADAAASGSGSAAPGDVDLGAALLAARGDNKKVMEIIANAPPEAHIRPVEIY
jgi:hypothetical protein